MSASRTAIVEDLLYALIGVECRSIAITREKEIEISVHPSMQEDIKDIINRIKEIPIGIREIKYKIEEMYYTREYIKHALLKGIEEEIYCFFLKVQKVQKAYKDEDSIRVEDFPFIFQEDILVFSYIRIVLEHLDETEPLYILQSILEKYPFLIDTKATKEVLCALNETLSLLIQGDTPEDLFKVRKDFGYDKCFWSGYLRDRPIPQYLKGREEMLYTAGKVSKIRETCGDTKIPFIGDILVKNQSIVFFNEEVFHQYISSLLDAPETTKKWKKNIATLFSYVILDVYKYNEIFQTLEENIFLPASEKDLAVAKSVMNSSSNFFLLSFFSKASLEDALHEKPSITFKCNNFSLSKTLSNIQETRVGASLVPPSFLQALDLSFSLKAPLSFFFSLKSLSEIGIIFRFLYSLYGIEYVLSKTPEKRRINHFLLIFVTALRMHITEKVIEESVLLIENEKVETWYVSVEKALTNILGHFLLTNPYLVSFYSRFFSLSFFYLDLQEKDMLSKDETEHIIKQFKELFKEALPHVKSSSLYMLFESLI
ncbi:hypothetical protein NEFER03_1696 [Nematocida sp. LUAm3]|nr:hypothetical protein NEFER03_1696 [Nematocida sp. LUAm3]KAI5175686.1 hypothetical protein NEFER02_1573 [Nematocida sp. LUAm2]KAI5178592.1 hypothetical protein NEFER01_1728 [Nematocida sp. LUAm1]